MEQQILLGPREKLQGLARNVLSEDHPVSEAWLLVG